MAIKYRGRNLERRIINGRDVEKVIYNGREIWPQETQHVDYHIVSPWTGGGAPGGWSTGGGGGGGGSFGPGGFYGGTAQYDGLPSLRNARKIKIVYQFTRTLASVPIALDARLLEFGVRTYQTQLVSGREQLFGCSHNVTMGFNAVPGLYTITTELDLERLIATQVLEGPDGLTSSIGTYSLNNTEVNKIRSSDQYLITLNNGVTLRQTDFYIWNMDSVSFIEGGTVGDLSSYTNLVSIVEGLNSEGFTVNASTLRIPLVGWIDTSGSYRAGTSWIWITSKQGEYTFNLNANNMRIVLDGLRAYGQFVRPVLDTFFEPDNSWTTIVGQVGGDGVFHNPGLEAISLIYGSSKISIADKNLGATQVWYPGDTAAPSNYGKFYQWGNCYGFPSSGFNTASQQVDTTGYGGGVFYSSDTYIIGHNDWSNPANDYLW